MPTNDELDLIVSDSDIGVKDKLQAYIALQGIRGNRVVASEEDGATGIIYVQYKDGTILKFVETIVTTKTTILVSRAADGTKWDDRATATYTSEVI